LSSQFLGEWLERIVPQRCSGLFGGVEGLYACGLLEGGVTGDLGFWCPSGMVSSWAPTSHFLNFRFLRGSFILDDLRVMLIPTLTPILSPSAYLRLCTYLILARSSLVLHVTLQREFQSLCLSLLGFFSPLTPFLNSISFWRTFVFYSSWK